MHTTSRSNSASFSTAIPHHFLLVRTDDSDGCIIEACAIISPSQCRSYAFQPTSLSAIPTYKRLGVGEREKGSRGMRRILVTLLWKRGQKKKFLHVYMSIERRLWRVRWTSTIHQSRAGNAIKSAATIHQSRRRRRRRRLLCPLPPSLYPYS